MLTVKNLQISIQETTLVQPLSFQLESGKSLALVGESGSGKSLICKAIANLLPQELTCKAEQIQLHINGKNHTYPLAQEELIQLRKHHIGFIFQEPMSALNPIMTCGYQLAEAMGAGVFTSKKYKHMAMKWLEKVKLPNPERMYQAYPHQLSGGQRQRLMIAMAMAKKPSLLIADEPTTALDMWVQREILTLIKELQNETQAALLFVSHDLDLVRSIAQQVLVLCKGKVEEQGEINTVWEKPQAAYTQALVAIKPKGNHKPKRLPTLEDFLTNTQQDITPEEPEIFTKKALEVKNISKKYIQKGKVTTALKEASFDLYQGERLGIAGGSGSGKSTLGKLICGLEHPDTGSIQFVNQHPKSKQKTVQLVFQDPFASLNPSLKISTQLMEVLTYNGFSKKEARQKSLELFLKTGLSEAQFNRYPHEFSGGQRQRICIVRALLLEPEILVCDESVSALDVSVSAQILNLLKDLRDELGFSILFISHDLQVLRYFCTRMMVMNAGEIVEIGETEALFTQAKNPFTKELLAVSF